MLRHSTVVLLATGAGAGLGSKLRVVTPGVSEESFLEVPTAAPGSHRRSAYAVVRKLNPNRGAEGFCSRRLLSQEANTIASVASPCLTPLCCCGAVLWQERSHTSHSLPQLDALAGLLLLNFYIKDVRRSEVLDEKLLHRWQRVAQEGGCADLKGVTLGALCSNWSTLVPSSVLPDELVAARMLLTEEDGEALRDVCLSLQDEIPNSEREVKKMKQLVASPLVLLMLVHHRTLASQCLDSGPRYVLDIQVVLSMLDSILQKIRSHIAISCLDIAAVLCLAHTASTACGNHVELAASLSAFVLVLANAAVLESRQHGSQRAFSTEVTGVAIALLDFHIRRLTGRSDVISKSAEHQQLVLEQLVSSLVLLGDSLRLPSDAKAGGHDNSTEVMSLFCACIDCIWERVVVARQLRVGRNGGTMEPTRGAHSLVDDHFLPSVALCPLVRTLMQWQKDGITNWLDAETARRLQTMCDELLATIAEASPQQALSLLEDCGYLDPLQCGVARDFLVPLLQRQPNEQLLHDALATLLSRVEVLYIGSGIASAAGSADRCASTFYEGFRKKKDALHHQSGASPLSDECVVNAILDDLASLGALLYGSHGGAPSPAPQVAVEGDVPVAQRMEPDAAFLGGPVEFTRFLVRCVSDVWADVRRLTTQDSEAHGTVAVSSNNSFVEPSGGANITAGNAASGVGASRAPQMGALAKASPVVATRFALLMETVIRCVLKSFPRVRIANPALAHLVERHLELPNMHDAYRRKLYLLVNISGEASPVTSSSSLDDGREKKSVSPELQKLTASLPHQFLPWTSIQLAKDVLLRSSGNSPQYLHLFQTVVDLQLPASTARSRIAGVLDVYKLIHSQRGKLTPSEYHALLLRCLWSLPLAYFLSSWTFFSWWLFVGCLVLLHVTGWSYEAAFVAANCKHLFSLEVDGLEEADRSRCIDWEDETLLDVLNESSYQRSSRVFGRSVVLLCPEKSLLAPSVDMSDIQRDVVSSICRSAGGFPFVLHVPVACVGGALLVDDVVSDAAMRIRRASNTSRNPLKRLLFNLFPLFRPDAQKALVSMLAAEAACRKQPVTFVLVIPEGVALTANTMQRLHDVFAARYKSSLFVVACSSAVKRLPEAQRLSFVLWTSEKRRHSTPTDDDDDESELGSNTAAVVCLRCKQPPVVLPREVTIAPANTEVMRQQYLQLTAWLASWAQCSGVVASGHYQSLPVHVRDFLSPPLAGDERGAFVSLDGWRQAVQELDERIKIDEQLSFKSRFQGAMKNSAENIRRSALEWYDYIDQQVARVSGLLVFAREQATLCITTYKNRMSSRRQIT